jgi:DDHD domain
MNSVVTYQDSTTAWLLTDDFLTRMSSTVYQRFAGGGYLGGVKIVRGYTEPGKHKESKSDSEKRPDTAAGPTGKGDLDSNRNLKAENAYKRRSAPPSTTAAGTPEPLVSTLEPEGRRQQLERDMSSLVTPASTEDLEKQEEDARRRDEKEMEDDYRDDHGEEQGREIEYLLLVTHGIGQRLGLRLESVNFIHDVNVFRKTLKSVYAASADLQALNSEVDKLPKNCRVQVLPVCWRHLLDFPKQSIRQNRREHDLGDADGSWDEEEYPSLSDITIEGVPAVRGLIADLALDILLYQSAYRDHISGIVLRECNRIYKLFCERNPSFKGRVSLVGHSLGSAILFDILCRQKDCDKATHHSAADRRKFYHNQPGIATQDGKELRFDFPVENLFCLGSPIGLFQMLKGRTIAARQMPEALPSDSPLNPDSMEGHVFASPNTPQEASGVDHTQLPYTVSSPKCAQLFNIFHPTDPISYRIEPLISPAMTALKPQPLPYTKKGIFDAPMGQGLSGIGTRVGQSVSGLWSSLSSGIASSILNRSLGLTSDGLPLTSQPSQPPQNRVPLSVGAGTNISAGVIPPTPLSDTDKKLQLANYTIAADELGEHARTLIDGEIETLYADFEKRRRTHQTDGGEELSNSAALQEAEERGRKLRREEAKVRALNSTGRVDFSIQE